MAEFPVPALPQIPVQGGGSYPVRRIFCVGRNYAAHAAEMGAAVDREAPFYFTKSPFAVVLSGASVPYAPGTQNLHHEMSSPWPSARRCSAPRPPPPKPRSGPRAARST